MFMFTSNIVPVQMKRGDKKKQKCNCSEGPPRSQNEEDDDEEAFNQSPDQFGLHEQTVVVRQAEKLIKRRLVQVWTSAGNSATQ